VRLYERPVRHSKLQNLFCLITGSNSKISFQLLTRTGTGKFICLIPLFYSLLCRGKCRANPLCCYVFHQQTSHSPEYNPALNLSTGFFTLALLCSELSILISSIQGIVTPHHKKSRSNKWRSEEPHYMRAHTSSQASSSYH
jgi:hypothetical protein